MMRPSRLLLAASFALALNTAIAAFTYPLLVVDTLDNTGLPGNFRNLSTAQIANPKINTSGLKNLLVAGSGQFSEKQLNTVVNTLHPNSLMIFDLRQEDHGFLNGNAISWYGMNNQANLNKTPQQVEQDQFQKLNALQNLPTTMAYEILKKGPDGSIASAKPLRFTVQTVFAESDLTRAYSFGYTRLYITDHMRPSDLAVQNFLTAYQALPSGSWTYVHCKAGLGRTTTILAMIDMLNNAKNVSLDDIIQRQAAIGGIDLSKLPSSSDINYQAAVDRYAFLQNFYNFAKSSGGKMSWTAWLQQQTIKANQATKVNGAPSQNGITPAVVTPAEPSSSNSLSTPTSANTSSTAPGMNKAS